MKKNSNRPTAPLKTRLTKVILEVDLLLQDQTPSDDYLAALVDAIHHLPLTNEQKRTLLVFCSAEVEPQPVNEKEYWRLEDQVRAVFRSLPKTLETKRFMALMAEGWGKSSEVLIGATAWAQSNRILRERWEHQKDWRAVGAVLGAREAVHGSVDDIAVIPEQWVREAVLMAAKEGKRIPTVGSGRHRTTSDEKRRAQESLRQKKTRALDRKARDKIQHVITAARQKIPYNPAEDLQETIHTMEIRILNEALTDSDPHLRKAARARKKGLEYKQQKGRKE